MKKKKAQEEFASKARSAACETEETEVAPEPKLPTEVHGCLTHQCCCFLELAEACAGDYSDLTEIGIQVWFQGMLGVASVPDVEAHLADTFRSGPIAMVLSTDNMNDDDSKPMWTPRKWWETVSAKLESSCVASLPADTFPSTYVL